MNLTNEDNRLIAEKIMGWKIHSRNTHWYVTAGKENDIVSPESVKADVGWNPETNDADAFELLGRLCDINKVPVLGKAGHDYYCGHIAIYGEGNESLVKGITTSPTLNSAVCAFALKLAKEGKV